MSSRLLTVTLLHSLVLPGKDELPYVYYTYVCPCGVARNVQRLTRYQPVTECMDLGKQPLHSCAGTNTVMRMPVM